MRKILIIGATSAIAQATARLFSETGDALFLMARDQNKLTAVAEDFRVRGAFSVHTAEFDVLDYDSHQPIIDQAISTLDGFDLVLVAHGTLSDQKACEESFDLTRKEFEVNAISVISMLTHLANYFEQKKSGTIVVISSVAGDRGRQSNYVYGSAKGAITIFLQGLRNRLYKSGVHVITVKPGFVDTPMTSSFPKGVLWVGPDKIAKDIVRAVNTDADTLYTPFYWKSIMLVIRTIPEKVFKRLSL